MNKLVIPILIVILFLEEDNPLLHLTSHSLLTYSMVWFIFKRQTAMLLVVLGLWMVATKKSIDTYKKTQSENKPKKHNLNMKHIYDKEKNTLKFNEIKDETPSVIDKPKDKLCGYQIGSSIDKKHMFDVIDGKAVMPK